MTEYFGYKSSLSSASIKDIDGKKGIVTGYFAAFNNVDSDRDIIRPGAFQKSINENGPQSAKPRIKHLLNHDVYKPLGKMLLLKEDNHGLYYESQVADHTLGREFIKMAEGGLITEHSIGFRTTRRNQLADPSKAKEGEAVWEIVDMKLYEGSSLTGWGANENTPLTGMKAADQLQRLNARVDMLIKNLRNGSYTDETFQELEIELKQLQQLSTTLATTQAESRSPAPDSQEGNDRDAYRKRLLLLNAELSA